MEQLYKELEVLEYKLLVYSENWGPDSEEVKQLECMIYEVNQKILDLMVC